MADPNPKLIIRAEDRTKAAFRSARSGMEEFKKSAALAAAAIAAVTVAAGALVKSTLSAQDEIGKLSTRIGASTEALSQYRFVAERTGVTFETLTMGWQRMTRRISEASNGTGEAVKALQELNLSARDLNRLRPEQQFEVLADAIMKVENPADRVRLSMKLFDSEGVRLIQTMEGGSKAIKELRERADELNLTLSKEATDAAADTQDAMTDLQASFKGVANQLTVALGPALEYVAKLLADQIPVLAKWAAHITDRVGIEIAAIWDWLNPSDITGPTTLEQSFKRMEEQLNANREAARAARDAMREAQNVAPEVGGADPERLEISWNKRLTVNALQMAREKYQWEAHEDARGAVIRGSIQRITKFELMTSRQKTKTLIGDAIAMTQGVAQESRALFEINKVAAIANAIISTYEAVAKAQTAYPPPFSQAMMALAAASGFAQVQAIRNTSFSGSGGGGSAPSLAGTGGGGQVVTTVPAQSTPQAPSITIYIEGSAIGNDHIREVIIDAIHTAQANDEL